MSPENDPVRDALSEGPLSDPVRDAMRAGRLSDLEALLDLFGNLPREARVVRPDHLRHDDDCQFCGAKVRGPLGWCRHCDG